MHAKPQLNSQTHFVYKALYVQHFLGVLFSLLIIRQNLFVSLTEKRGAPAVSEAQQGNLSKLWTEAMGQQAELLCRGLSKRKHATTYVNPWELRAGAKTPIF